jgi:hypothetical protein
MFYHLIDSPMTIAAIPLDPIPTNHSNLLVAAWLWILSRTKTGSTILGRVVGLSWETVEMAWGSLLLLLSAVFGRKDLDILDDLGIFSMSGCTHFTTLCCVVFWPMKDQLEQLPRLCQDVRWNPQWLSFDTRLEKLELLSRRPFDAIRRDSDEAAGPLPILWKP